MNLTLVNKIAVKLLALIALALVASTLIFLVLAHNFSFKFLSDPSRYTGNFVAKYNIVMLLIFLLSILVFIAIFMIPVNRKLGYLHYITQEVRRIAEQNNLGLVVEIRGKDELAELGLSINAMSQELQKNFEREREAERTKSELITNLSHDLRSPLTSIIGYLDLIKGKKFKTEGEFNDYLDTIHSKSQKLKGLIDELFEYTKLSHPGFKLDYQKIEFSGLLEQIIGEYLPVLDGEGLTISKKLPQEDVEAEIDVEKIVRVLTNLLENAAKYSVKPSQIEILLTKKADKVRMSILNEVEHLPAQPPEKLFARFYKEDYARTEDGSSGLGLAIAQKIVELHGGSIWAIYLDKAVEFSLELPLAAHPRP
ncbi:HAMP domain-containing sensor histidine kinase [Desulfosporosinus sp. PR]|uniref:HAMP domain-containing sensor histidine kinase n=1 Tax=Candidatus Desulfosporosinus nitrosoreducens TaxID=3401928 RepID=UPI0027EE4619|nr:HAMP domain-containing sensor histidine kinase [Desulfosporosinus sp. PR]MDQ7095729.1 HAMP domain-containing sensor histidine kinase [Desulfosporosinus sp. PR]